MCKSLTDQYRTTAGHPYAVDKAMLRQESKATVLGTMDYPQGNATITYVPAQPLAAGKHSAAITMVTPTGDQTISWTFETTDIPCS